MVSVFPPISDDFVRRYDVQAPRYTSYPTVPVWSSALSGDSLDMKLRQAADHPSSPLSMYVHLPFCRERCTFCGCNVVVTKDAERADRYLDYLELELDMYAERLGSRRLLSQLHWGGGTPTFLDEQQLERLWGMITNRFHPLPDAEISVEIDPVVTSKGQLDLLRELGVNRISLGVQDFDPAVQEAVNRIQTVDETRTILDHARSLGFASVNFDLIYGLPMQTSETWRSTLENVLTLRPDRMAVYSFAFVPTMRPHQKRLAVLPMASGVPKLELFRDAYETFVNGGYNAIGMDHFALPSDELSTAQEQRRLTRNFQGYTVKQATDVIAFGSSAISDLQGLYAQNVQALPKYYSMLEARRFPVERGILLSDDDRRRRRIINEIMCNFWVDLGPQAPTMFARELTELRGLESEGMVKVKGTELEILPAGRVFVRNVATVFDAYLDRDASKPVGFSRTI